MRIINKELVGARGFVLLGSLGSWFLLLKVMCDYLKTGKILIASYQNLVVLSFSLALLSFISGMEIHSKTPLRINGTKGFASIFTVCTFSSAFVVLLCLALIVVDQKFLGRLISLFP